MGAILPLLLFATSSILPNPLPTTEASTASQHALQEYSGRRIIRVGDCFIVKYGASVSLVEGENMLFVKRTSSIPDLRRLLTVVLERAEVTAELHRHGERCRGGLGILLASVGHGGQTDRLRPAKEPPHSAAHFSGSLAC